MPGTNAVKLDEMIKALELVHEGKAKLVNCNETEYINIMEKAFEELQIKDDFMFLYRHRYKCLVSS